MKQRSPFLLISLLVLLSSSTTIFGYRVGLLVMATGRYIEFVPALLTSARKHFCTNHDVIFFIFTDQEASLGNDVVLTYQKRLGWPYDSMHRFHTYLKNREILESMDYLFACDADMLFADTVGEEILSDRVGTQHPGFPNGKRGNYEKDSRSKACVSPREGRYYFAGGFYGGKRNEFFKLLETTSRNIDIDQKNNIMAVWHDESHLNRYFIDNPPTKVLSSEYCYQENTNAPYRKRLIALNKNHAEYRK